MKRQIEFTTELDRHLYRNIWSPLPYDLTMKLNDVDIELNWILSPIRNAIL